MEARAQAKNIRVSAQKARLVVDLVRGKSVKDALGILEYTNKSATPAIIKVISSAAANAVHNEGADKDKLVIKSSIFSVFFSNSIISGVFNKLNSLYL